MKSYRTLGSLVVAFGFVVPEAYAQSLERVAALDPASVPGSASAPLPAAAPAASVEAAPAPAAAVQPAAPAAPPAPLAAPVSAATPALTSPIASRRKDEASSAPDVPIRARRKLALLGEVGWNSLGGFGAVLTYNAHPHLAFDLAGGLSFTGWKAGLRGRYNLLTGPVTPFVGAGLSMSAGLKGARFGGDGTHNDGFERSNSSQDGEYNVKASEFAQAVVGFEFMHHAGFTMQASAGYSWLLNHHNFDLVAGQPHNDVASVLFGSGPVVSTAFGYAFN